MKKAEIYSPSEVLSLITDHINRDRGLSDSVVCTWLDDSAILVTFPHKPLTANKIPLQPKPAKKEDLIPRQKLAKVSCVKIVGDFMSSIPFGTEFKLADVITYGKSRYPDARSIQFNGIIISLHARAKADLELNFDRATKTFSRRFIQGASDPSDAPESAGFREGVQLESEAEREMAALRASATSAPSA